MLNGIAKFFRDSFWARILIPAGLILMVASVFVFIAVDNTKDYVKTEAVVSKVELYEEAHYDTVTEQHEEATYTVTVKYTADGTEYEEVLGDGLVGYKVGDTTTICYNPEDPTQISQPSGLWLPIVILAAGIAAVIGGIFSIFVAVKKNKALKEQEKEWANGN